jgi:histidyl-tRNA synthetase
MEPAENLEALQKEIAEVTASLHELKTSKADPALTAEQSKKLGELKKQLALATNAGGKRADAKKARLQLKTPKGTRDYIPLEMSVREHIINTLTRVFKAHGAVTIDTPVFELREILAGKYGEDSKLIYDLQDQGGELCSLRYDLTVPFARFLAMNGGQYPNIKRYHIAKVYRRDAPAMTKGRMREFYQCDIDIAGSYDPMVPDAEILCIFSEALTALEVGEFVIKVNHRKVLDGIFEVCGVPSEKIRSISSAVDKLDKLPWADVRREMTEEKGLDPAVADQIGEFVKLKGGPELLAQLRETRIASNKSALAGLQDMELLFKYLDVFGVTPKVSFDLSLARGLDYYTGIIYEAVVEGSAPPPPASVPSQPSHLPPTTSSQPTLAPVPVKPKKKVDASGEEELDESSVGIGSIGAGGRYDSLVGMFATASAGVDSKKKSSAHDIPCVGVSFGVERIFSLLMQRMKEQEKVARSKETEVFVISVGDGLLVERMALAKELWDAGIKAEFMYKNKPKLRPQFEVVDREQIPLAVIIGPDEIRDGVVRVKEQKGKEETESNDLGSVVKRTELIDWLKQKL